jgi:hypothetical protein
MILYSTILHNILYYTLHILHDPFRNTLSDNLLVVLFHSFSKFLEKSALKCGESGSQGLGKSSKGTASLMVFVEGCNRDSRAVASN